MAIADDDYRITNRRQVLVLGDGRAGGPRTDVCVACVHAGLGTGETIEDAISHWRVVSLRRAQQDGMPMAI